MIYRNYTTGEQDKKPTLVVAAAIKDGTLTRPHSCELCDVSETIRTYTRYGKMTKRSSIVAHHWNGYDHPLDVWWICTGCNRILYGKYFHSGQVSKEEARQIVMQRRANKP